MNIFLEILGLAALSFAYPWEVLNDKDGDAHVSRGDWNDKYKFSSKTLDVWARCFFMVVASALNILFTQHNFFVSLFLAGAIHFLLFDYTITYVLIKRKILEGPIKWYDYSNGKGFDNYKWWTERSWQVRMSLKVVVFLVACVIYFDLIKW